MEIFSDFIIEKCSIKYLEIPFNKEQVFQRLKKNIIVTESVPWTLRKRSYSRNEMPYFSGLANQRQNKIELLYNPYGTDMFVRLSAKVSHESENSSKVEYELYRGGGFMSLTFYLAFGFIFIWMSVALSDKNIWNVLKIVMIFIGFFLLRFIEILLSARNRNALDKLINMRGYGFHWSKAKSMKGLSCFST